MAVQFDSEVPVTGKALRDLRESFMKPDTEPTQPWNVHKWLTISLQAIIALGLVFSLYEQQWLNAIIVTGILLLTFLPVLFGRGLNIFIPAEFELLTIAFIFAALFHGETQRSTEFESAQSEHAGSREIARLAKVMSRKSQHNRALRSGWPSPESTLMAARHPTVPETAPKTGNSRFQAGGC